MTVGLQQQQEHILWLVSLLCCGACVVVGFVVVVVWRKKYSSWTRNTRLVEGLWYDKHIRDRRVYDAMMKVNRGYFVTGPDSFANQAVCIGFGATICEPRVTAIGLDVISEIIRPGSTVLELGCGCGYVTAILSILVGPTGRVVAVESASGLIKQCQANIAKIDSNLLNRVIFLVSDSKLGSPVHGPYNAIYSSSAVDKVPPTLVEQLKVGGRLLIHVGPETGFHQLIQVDKRESGLEPAIRSLGNVRFVPVDNAGEQVTYSKSLKMPIAPTYVPAPDMSPEQLEQLKQQLTENNLNI
ncbi:protein-L-isoaspartate O-methyltransferase [Pelomyxa schiedti]|nr:protein-L-isoaspartate O-methyltransferase [Pelomyxa schiedti]